MARRNRAAAHGRAGDGWSAFSRRNAPGSPSASLGLPAADEFCPLPTSHPLLDHRPSLLDPSAASFAHVLRRALPDPDPAVPRTPADPVHSRLLDLHPWADADLISDVLRAFHLDEDSASSYLSTISDENTQSTSASECPSSSQDDNDESAVEAAGKQLIFPYSIASAPLEPEWVEDDIYYSSRKEALRMSRTSGKHSRSAHRAFLNGDHSKATMFSKKASKERLEAERMHQEAAERIFQARNGDSLNDLWRIDLHGLHVREAVAALQTRLLHIEALLCHSRHASVYAADGNISNSRSTKEVSCSDTDSLSCQKNTHREKTAMPKRYLPLGRGIEVITGVGNHSRDGGSLPNSIRNFLIQNRYKFQESRPGMLMVYPKFQFPKDK